MRFLTELRKNHSDVPLKVREELLYTKYIGCNSQRRRETGGDKGKKKKETKRNRRKRGREREKEEEERK